MTEREPHRPPTDDEWAELTEAARRGLQRAGVHMVKAAIEVVAGISAFLDEVAAAGEDGAPEGSGPAGPTRIEVD